MEAIEAASLRSLNFITETLDEVLVDDTIGRSEEGENVANEVALVVVQFVLPVMNVPGLGETISSPSFVALSPMRRAGGQPRTQCTDT